MGYSPPNFLTNLTPSFLSNSPFLISCALSYVALPIPNFINVVALCDISSSMFTVEKNSSTIKFLTKIIAASAVEHGDIFSMVCYNDAIKNNFFLEPSNNIFNINRWIDALVFEGPRATSDDIAGINHKIPYEK